MHERRFKNGDKVTFESEGDMLVLRRAEKSSVDKLKKIAEETGEVEVDSDKDYDERMRS